VDKGASDKRAADNSAADMKPSGPSAQDMQAAAKLPPDQQNTMIRGMVERLAERLKTDAGDVNGWIMLVRSYNVLGERDKANAAAADAQRVLASDPEKLARLQQGLKSDAASAGGNLGQATANVAQDKATANVAQDRAAANLPPDQQSTMIRGMVERLAERLKTDGSDVNGWIMLVHSYNVLGERDKASAAAADAQRVLASDPEKLARLQQSLKSEAAGTGGNLGQATANVAQDKATANAAQDNATANTTQDKASPADPQGAMIRAMVDRLAARLKQDGTDVDGWLKLLRSYTVLGEPDRARAALADARKAVASDAGKLQRLDAGARDLGVAP
jgi:cytochrome c-type biogenesis protein CcmH/NrfG